MAYSSHPPAPPIFVLLPSLCSHHPWCSYAQLVVSEVSTENCGRQFIIVLDFFPPPPSSGRTLDTAGISRFLATNPGYLDPSAAQYGQPEYLDQAEFGLQYVQKLEQPSKYTASQ